MQVATHLAKQLVVINISFIKMKLYKKQRIQIPVSYTKLSDTTQVGHTQSFSLTCSLKH